MLSNRLDGLFAFVCLLGSSAVIGVRPAVAQTVSVSVMAKGTVTPSCSMASSQGFASANFNAPSSSTAKASLSCNQFFTVKATSTNGAITSAVSASGNLVNRLPYTLKVDVPLDNGVIATATCAATALQAGQSTCPLSPANSTGLTSQGQIATNKAVTLTATWTPPNLPQMLVPGSYSDTITLSIATVP